MTINHSFKQNLISVNLAKRLQVPEKHIETAQVDNEDVQVYKDLKISMDKYVLHGDFYASEMDNMDVVLGYPWMESVGTININVHKKFLKLWYKKKKITLQDISINKQVESKDAEGEDVPGSAILDDEPVMIDNQIQTEAEAEKVIGVDTSEEGSVAEVILEDNEDILMDVTDVAVKVEEVETQGVDPITRLLEYVPLCEPKTKVSRDINESKTPLQTPLLLAKIVFDRLCLARVPLLKLEDWDLADNEKFPHLATKQLMHCIIDTNSAMTALELWRWLRGVDKAGLLNLIWVPHYNRTLVTVFFIKQLL